MINSALTIYHKTINPETKLEQFTRKTYQNVWWFGEKRASINTGYENSNAVEIRIFDKVDKISIGDILVKGNVTLNITQKKELDGYEVYNVTSIKNNNFGTRPHIHIGGK